MLAIEGSETTLLPEASSVCSVSEPPLMVYFTFPFPSPPLIVKIAEEPEQIGPLPITLIVDAVVGLLFTNTLAVFVKLVTAELHPNVVLTDVKRIVWVLVIEGSDTTLPPEASSVSSVSEPPLRVYFTFPFPSPPLIVKIAEVPEQIGPLPITLIVDAVVGLLFTNTLAVFVKLVTTELHPNVVLTDVNRIV